MADSEKKPLPELKKLRTSRDKRDKKSKKSITIPDAPRESRGSKSESRESKEKLSSLLLERESVLRIKHILDECQLHDKQHDPQDWKDKSFHPSFSNFQVPYFMICRDRYVATRNKYEEQFQYEIEELLANQSTAYEAARLSRHMCITTLWPPLHNRREIKNTQRYFFPMTHKQRRRYQYIMSTNFLTEHTSL